MPPETELTLDQLNLLREALLASYSDFDEIRTLVRFQLGDRLQGVPQPIGLQPGVGKVIDWADQKGRMGDLIEAFRKAERNNAKTAAFFQSLDAGFVLPVKDFEETHVPAHWTPKASGLEAIVEEANPIQLAAGWRERMAAAERRVCRIERAPGKPKGTGFLVGSDLVLTNCHVYRAIEGASALARFDYTADGAKGVQRGFKAKRPLAISTEDRLDFALLRLDAPMEEDRGWFRPKSHSFTVNQVHAILQHPDGDPLSLGIGLVTAVLKLPPRVTYNTNTKGGSSGSPAFTMDWELVAIHHWGSAENNVGIPMGAIWEMLGKKHLV